MNAKGLVVICQQGLSDPLVAPLMLNYVSQLKERRPSLPVLFITEEPVGSKVPAALLQQLGERGIRWKPLRYDVKGAQWLQRFRNVLALVLAAGAFRLRTGPLWLVGYLSYAGTYALLLQWLGLGRGMVVCFEPHSRYMVEMGLWSPGSLKTRVTAWFEKAQMRHLKAVVVPTLAGFELAGSYSPKGRLRLHGITIDVEAARFNGQQRTQRRSELGFRDETVLVYVGKFGGIYHSMDDYMDFLLAMHRADPAMRFMVITQAREVDRIRRHQHFAQLSAVLRVFGPVPPEDLPGWLSAADIGVVAIPPTPAQAFRTPVKTAHYWAAGLPVIIAEGISDDHVLVAKDGTGIVVDDLPKQDASVLANRCTTLLAEDRAALRERCMAAAARYRGTDGMVELLEEVLFAAG